MTVNVESRGLMIKKLNELQNWAHDSFWKTMLAGIVLGTVFAAIFLLCWAGLHLAFPESIRSAGVVGRLCAWAAFVGGSAVMVATPIREKKKKE